jgi:hypothetical protein
MLRKPVVVLVLFCFFQMIIILCLAEVSLAGNTRSIQLTVRETNIPPKTVQLYDNMTAVIIGIDRYENLPPSNYLAYAVKDAKGVEEVDTHLER